MPYYMRILGKRADDVPVRELADAAKPAILEVGDGDDSSWQQLLLKHASGTETAVIEKNPVVKGELGADELQEFIDEAPHYKPDSAATWLQSYLPGVKVIYAFQLLSGTEVDDGWTPLHRAYSALWKRVGGILQADGEGFTNEAGHTILWQFGASASGPWKVAVLDQAGRWIGFEIDLGNAAHREAFQLGNVPKGVKPLT